MVIGRTVERARIDRLLADARLNASGVLAIVGEPGIGKTALLEYAAESAAAAGMDTLGARGAEFEAGIPFGGLLELLRPALGELDGLPAAQAQALRGALDLGPQLQPDRYLIGAATLNLLSARAERAPLLVLADDAHWLDESSLAALLFAARRLLVDPVAILIAARAGEAPALDAARFPELALGGLDAGSAAALLGRLGATPAPGAAERLVAATGGNPLALVELARSGAELDPEPLAGPLAIETSAEVAYRRRIEALPAPAQAVLALGAAEESGQLATIVAAAEAAGLDPAGLQEGERTGLVTIEGGALAWRHALARSAAYRAVAPGPRRALHAALAGVLTHPSQLDRRAWHLAAAALGPDEAVAAALDDAARRARARSAHGAAAAAAERAAALSASPDARARRLYDAAESAWLGGHAARAVRSLEQALELAPEPRLRAELDHLHGQATIRAGDLIRGHEILVAGAQAIERTDPAKAVVMLADAAEACIYVARPRRMLEVSRRAWELLEPGAGERERFFANLALGTASLFSGVREDGAARIREALAILEASDTLLGDPRSLSAAALGPLWLRDSGDERALIDRAIASARERGALGTLPLALALSARDAATSDRPGLGTALFEESARLARETGQEMPLCAALTWLTGADARAGREAACREHGAEALALAERHGLAFLELWTLDGLGELELGLGNADAARAALERKQRLIDEHGLTDPDLSPAPDLVEIAVRAGTPPPPIDVLEREAAAKGQPWALARHARAVALLAGRDEVDAAFAGALKLFAATHDRFETARTHLCYGERLRRTGQRVRARAELRRALEAFEALGSAPWEERTRAELEASGVVARRRDPSTLDDLTPQELQIGMLLAAGATTREVAAQLFLSPKTVEYHQRNAYRKLGIHSREELAAELAKPRGVPEAKAASRP